MLPRHGPTAALSLWQGSAAPKLLCWIRVNGERAPAWGEPARPEPPRRAAITPVGLGAVGTAVGQHPRQGGGSALFARGRSCVEHSQTSPGVLAEGPGPRDHGGKVQQTSGIPPAPTRCPPSNVGTVGLPISGSACQRQNQLLSHSHLRSSPGAASTPRPFPAPGPRPLALPGQAAQSSPSNGEMPQKTGLTMFLFLSRSVPRQRGTSGCSSRSRSWPKPCRAHGSGRHPLLPHPSSAPPRMAAAPAPTISPCPRHRGKAVSPRFWPSGISSCLPKQPPCSCLGHGKGSLLVITEWWAPDTSLRQLRRALLLSKT